jgi:hypothetical protein
MLNAHRLGPERSLKFVGKFVGNAKDGGTEGIKTP